MVEVKLWGSLRRFANGAEYVDVHARNVKQLLEALSEKHPGLKPELDRGVSVAVDGVIHQNAWFVPVSDECEVVLMPYMEGG